MRKAIVYVKAHDFLRLLKLPANIQVVSMEYGSNGDEVKIVLEGEGLPMDEISPKAKRWPTMDYEVRQSWHMARITPAEVVEETENEKGNQSISVSET